MKARIIFYLIFLVLIVTGVNANEKGPVVISPGIETGVAVVGQSCPTFSWAAVEWAVGYRVEVYFAVDNAEFSYEELAAISFPVMSKEIMGQALSWTPSSDERLSNGGEYIWYVQAVDAYGGGMWSEGKVFKVDIGFRFDRVEERVSERLREHGVSDDVIDDVLKDVKETIVQGLDAQSISDITQNIIGIQGLEGNPNTFYGLQAGFSISTGINNSFFGLGSGYDTSTGNDNTFVGYGAGTDNTASNNTFIGSKAGFVNTTGADNTFIGQNAGYTNTTGDLNTFIGNSAGYTNSAGSFNTFVGWGAGTDNTAGNNTFIGYQAGYSNTVGTRNTFVGYNAGHTNFTADHNTFVGYGAGYGNSTGSKNTFLGELAGRNNSSGTGNVILGYLAGYDETGSNKLYIDNSDTSAPLIWGDFGNDILTVHGKLGIGTKSPVYQMEIETSGENAILLLDRTDGAKTGFSASGDKCAFGTLTNHPLWMVINGAFSAIFHTDGSLQMMNGAWCTAAGKWQDASSRELKENIQGLTVEEAKEALEGLEPIRFYYKADKEDESLGFIAEDVPELVASKDRKSMSAMDVVAVLTKVMQEQQEMIKKQQNVAQEQQKAIAELQRRIDELEQRK